jgi:O-antigen/teichoic acid export membrane protein
VLTAIGTAAGFFLRDFIFALLVGPEFRDAAPLLPWMVAAAGLFAAGQVLSLGLMAEVDTARLIRPKIVTALVGVVFNVGGAAWAGVTGVAIASCVFGLVYLAWIAMLVRSAPGPRA